MPEVTEYSSGEMRSPRFKVWRLKALHTRWQNRIGSIHFSINLMLDLNDLAMFVQVVRTGSSAGEDSDQRPECSEHGVEHPC